MARPRARHAETVPHRYHVQQVKSVIMSHEDLDALARNDNIVRSLASRIKAEPAAVHALIAEERARRAGHG